jgi:thymidine kinase
MSLEIIMGPMFSGKTTHAISFIRRQRFIGSNVLAIKPQIDMRYSSDNVIISHDKDFVPCLVWDSSNSLEYSSIFDQVDYVVIEEAQFFRGLYSFVKQLLFKNKNVLLVGLDGDSEQQKFGEILDCIPYATHIQKLNALCLGCKGSSLAPFTKKLTKQQEQIDVGSSDKYVAVCLKHLLEE